MYFQIASVIGEDVTVVEEDGYYKVRVLILDKDKIKDFLEPEENLKDVNSGDQPQETRVDTTVYNNPVTDSVTATNALLIH